MLKHYFYGWNLVIFRLANHEDSAAILRLSETAGPGMTTMPRSMAEIEHIIAETHRFVAGNAMAHRVFFVAEMDGVIGGISAIIPRLGLDRPFYSFKKSRHTRRSQNPKLSVTYETLSLTTDFDGYSELATLFVAAHARGSGLAQLLSLGRLAFICTHRAQFQPHLMADIRGWFNEAGVSPFWEHLTSKFIDMSYDEADRLSMNEGHFIDQILPAVPLFLNIVPQDVAQCVGRPNEASLGAVRLLKQAGFRMSDMCDVFDGGPSMVCETDKTLIAQTATQIVGAKPLDSQSDQALIWTGAGADFRATIGAVDWQAGVIDDKLAKALGSAPIYMARLRLTDKGVH